VVLLPNFAVNIGPRFGVRVALMPHPADVLLDLGLLAALLSVTALLMVVLASRSARKRKDRLPPVEGTDRSQRRREAAEAGRRRR